MPSGEQKPVVLRLSWKGVAEGASGVIGDYTLDGTTDSIETSAWQATVSNLPTHTSATGDITYSVEEVTVDGKTPSEAGFSSTVAGDQTQGFTVTNSPSFTPALVIYKYGDNEDEPLEGAQFTITGADGFEKTVQTSGADKDDTPDGYTAIVQGLKPGATYTVTENRTSSGHEVLGSAFTVTMPTTPDGEIVVTAEDGDVATGGTKLDGHDDVYVIKVQNKGIKPMPSTGSSGTVAMGAAGVATVLLAGAWLISKNKGFLIRK